MIWPVVIIVAACAIILLLIALGSGRRKGSGEAWQPNNEYTWYGADYLATKTSAGWHSTGAVPDLVVIDETHADQ